MINWKEQIKIDEHILLKKTVEDDFKICLKWFRDTRLRNFILDMEQYSDEQIKNDFLASLYGPFSIAYSIFIDGILIGKIDAQYLEYEKKAKVGIIIGEPNYWDKGIGTRSMQKILEELFNLGFIKIKIDIISSNHRSRKIAQKLNFKIEGIRKHDVRKGDKRLDMLEYALFNPTYPYRKRSFNFLQIKLKFQEIGINLKNRSKIKKESNQINDNSLLSNTFIKNKALSYV